MSDEKEKPQGDAIDNAAELHEASDDSLKQTYSRLSKRSTLLDRLRRKKSKSPSASASSLSDSLSVSPSPDLPPLSPLVLSGYRATTRHRLLTQELANNIRDLLPGRYQLFDDWHLVYLMEQHGISLKTLYQNCNPDYQREQKRRNHKARETGFADNIVLSMIVSNSSKYATQSKRHHGYVLVIKDETQAKFGCFLNEHLRPKAQRRYYGNGECFLWKEETFDPQQLSHTSEKNAAAEQTRFKAFMYTGVNDNVIYSDQGFIAVGSSDGRNGLWIDQSLLKGVSCACDTFGNEILNGQSDGQTGRFKILGLEVWRIGDYDI